MLISSFPNSQQVQNVFLRIDTRPWVVCGIEGRREVNPAVTHISFKSKTFNHFTRFVNPVSTSSIRKTTQIVDNFVAIFRKKSRRHKTLTFNVRHVPRKTLQQYNSKSILQNLQIAV